MKLLLLYVLASMNYWFAALKAVALQFESVIFFFIIHQSFIMHTENHSCMIK